MSQDDHYLKKELYERMQTSPFVFEFLQRGSLDGIWYWDIEEPEHEWLSPRFWEVLGYDPAQREHLAAEWQDLIFAEDLATTLDNFEKHCADPDHPYDQIVRYRHRDGSTVWVRCRGMAIRDAEGRPTRLLGAHTDVTQLKEAEARLRTETEALEEANRQLRAAMDRIGVLEKILPLCMFCKRIRDDEDRWQEVHEYITSQTGSQFSHGMCPECAAMHY